jgi:hypothetical protein
VHYICSPCPGGSDSFSGLNKSIIALLISSLNREVSGSGGWVGEGDRGGLISEYHVRGLILTSDLQLQPGVQGVYVCTLYMVDCRDSEGYI